MPETTENFHRVPTGKRTKKGEKIRTITVSKGIKALYDVKNKVIITYLFDKDKYTMKQAKEWVNKHKGSKTHDTLVELDLVQFKRDELTEQYKQEVLAAIEE
jgi:hypothetical protein